MAKAKIKSLEELYKEKSNELEEEDEFIESGSVMLDVIISNGKGFPRKKFIQITSESGAGKSTMLLHACKKACKEGKHVIYIDTEKGINESQINGVGLTDYLGNQFLLFKVDTYDNIEEILESALSDTKLDIAYVVIDSITAIIPDKLLDKRMSESAEVGLKARQDSLFLQKYKAILNRSSSKASFLFINQMRTNISFVNTTVGEAGGQAQKYYMDIRLMGKVTSKIVRKIITADGSEEDAPIGALVDVWALKSRYNQPFVKGTVAVLYGKGISNLYTYVSILTQKGYISGPGGGGWYTLKLPDMEPQKCQGMAKLQNLVAENITDVMDIIEREGGIQLMKEKGAED